MNGYATRYACEHARNETAGLQHESGNGKPRHERCRYCKGKLRTETGLWGVFHWSGGNGRYPASDALQVFKSESRANRQADRSNTAERVRGKDMTHVVRWIPREQSQDSGT